MEGPHVDIHSPVRQMVHRFSRPRVVSGHLESLKETATLM